MLCCIGFQVKFMHVSKVLAKQTKGRADYGNWVISYRIEYSQDCVTFNGLMDVNGNNHVRNVFIHLSIC